MSNREYIKNLRPGQQFRTGASDTLYTADHVYTEGGRTGVDYHVTGDGPGGRYFLTKPALSTVEVVR